MSLDEVDHELDISQEITYINNSETTLKQLYLNDWANSFSSKTTPLAKRFSENFKNGFHFEKDENRGKTTLHSITDSSGAPLVWQRGDEADILVIPLDGGLPPGESFTLRLSYTIKLPEDKFTRYGVTREFDYRVKYWLITPAVFDGEWQAYSNKNTDDYFQQPTDYSIEFTIPENYTLFTDLNEVKQDTIQQKKQLLLQGNSRMRTALYIEQTPTFRSVVTDQVEVVTNLQDKKVTSTGRALLVDRITYFLADRLGAYPHEKILVSDNDYRDNPVYGFNQLPDFISPFPEGFELDMELLKTLARKYITTSLPVHPRNDHWIIGALQIYLMVDYVNAYYPEMKLMGSVANFPVIKWSHASDVEFNDQYPFLYMNMARNNLHQALSMPKDSLVKFNKNIASDYQAGQGFRYLSDYLGKETLDKVIKELYSKHRLAPTTVTHLQELVKANTNLPVDWFFEDYVGKRTLIDFKIKEVTHTGDSLQLRIKNLRDNKMPVSVYGLDENKGVVFKQWTEPFDTWTTITVPKENVRQLALNYEAVIPEFNQRNNYKTTKGLFNRPLQFRVFQDVEDPEYNQLFFMPEFQYNLYDGFITGIKAYNKTFLPKRLSYKLIPQYGFRSKTLIGRGSIAYTTVQDAGSHYSTRYGLAGNTFSYNEGLFYRRLSPFVTFAFRDNSDLRKNMRQYLNFRSVNIFRDEDPNDPDQEPNYSV
ncbi:MAG: metalloprotease, partial [Bacteroidota bacterium]